MQQNQSSTEPKSFSVPVGDYEAKYLYDPSSESLTVTVDKPNQLTTQWKQIYDTSYSVRKLTNGMPINVYMLYSVLQTALSNDKHSEAGQKLTFNDKNGILEFRFDFYQIPAIWRMEMLRVEPSLDNKVQVLEQKLAEKVKELGELTEIVKNLTNCIKTLEAKYQEVENKIYCLTPRKDSTNAQPLESRKQDDDDKSLKQSDGNAQAAEQACAPVNMKPNFYFVEQTDMTNLELMNDKKTILLKKDISNITISCLPIFPIKERSLLSFRVDSLSPTEASKGISLGVAVGTINPSNKLLDCEICWYTNFQSGNLMCGTSNQEVHKVIAETNQKEVKEIKLKKDDQIGIEFDGQSQMLTFTWNSLQLFTPIQLVLDSDQLSKLMPYIWLAYADQGLSIE